MENTQQTLPSTSSVSLPPKKEKNRVLFFVFLGLFAVIGFLVALVLSLLFRGAPHPLTVDDLAAVDVEALPSSDDSASVEPSIIDAEKTVAKSPTSTDGAKDDTKPAQRFTSTLLPLSFVPPTGCSPTPQEAVFNAKTNADIVRGTSYNAVLISSVGAAAAAACPIALGGASADFYSTVGREGTPLDLIGYEYREKSDELFLPVWWAKEDVSGYTFTHVKKVKTQTGETTYVADAPSVFDDIGGTDIIGLVPLPVGTSPSAVLFYTGTAKGEEATAMRKRIELLLATVRITSEE